jgi:hypothetical protein
VVLLAGTAACSTPARVRESDGEQLSGCFRRIYGDGPPRSGAGGVWYTLTTDAGATTVLEVSPSLLAGAGGPSLLDGARVRVVLEPMRDSSNVRAQTARVRDIRRESHRSGAPC